MSESRCVQCGRGQIEFRRVPNFATRVRGVPFTVPEATIGFCNSCGVRLFDPKEIRRWERLYDAEQQRTGGVLSAVEIAQIRGELGLPINLFARLIGTTRQSVYNWERSDRKSPQLRLADLFLRLIRESLAHGAFDVLGFLREQAGMSQTARSFGESCSPRRRVVGWGWSAPEEYDRLFRLSGAPVELPRLRM